MNDKELNVSVGLLVSWKLGSLGSISVGEGLSNRFLSMVSEISRVFTVRMTLVIEEKTCINWFLSLLEFNLPNMLETRCTYIHRSIDLKGTRRIPLYIH